MRRTSTTYRLAPMVLLFLAPSEVRAQSCHLTALGASLCDGPTAGEPGRDSDGDGISDRLEEETGTAPLRSDTDRDGIDDGEEDTNRDGVVDEGETDPRRAGLFIGSAPHIPEPLNFDLVRGLGAHRGELETNVLISIRPQRGGLRGTTWAPEVEWAFADGLALELEVPMSDREVHALKAAFQWTMPVPGDNSFTHGVQLLAEHLLDVQVTELALLYLAGARLGRVSLFAMAGVRASAAQGAHVEVLVNPSLFYDANEAVTLGVEGNVAQGVNGGRSGLVLAQIHWQVARRFRVQVGAGAEFQQGTVGALVVTRLILE